MTWQTNTFTYVKCDDAHHDGDRIFKVETAFWKSIPEALVTEGWTYNHALLFHRCPRCTRRYARLN
jgi:hypothetical protein